MKKATAKIGILPSALGSYVSAIESTGVGFKLEPTLVQASGKIHMNLCINSKVHNGTEIVLNPDGTWTASTEITVTNHE